MESFTVFCLMAFDWLMDLVTRGGWSRVRGAETVADYWME